MLEVFLHYCLGLLLFLLGLDLGNSLLFLGLQCFDKVNGAHNRVHCILILYYDLDVLLFFTSSFCPCLRERDNLFSERIYASPNFFKVRGIAFLLNIYLNVLSYLTSVLGAYAFLPLLMKVVVILMGVWVTGKAILARSSMNSTVGAFIVGSSVVCC